jgi:hypothetical protein
VTKLFSQGGVGPTQHTVLDGKQSQESFYRSPISQRYREDKQAFLSLSYEGVREMRLL